jgi:hypothetical protein
VNNFAECLKQSHAASDWNGWEALYRKAFPTFAAMIDHRQNGEHQLAGIDRSIVLENSTQILVDEKVRGKNRVTGVVYKDIALEFMSNNQKKTPGWVVKPLRADYIAYLIAPRGECYLLPVQQLQKAWLLRGEEWKSKYGIKYANNEGYQTKFCPVHVNELYQAIGAQLRVSFEPFDFIESAR